MAHSLIDMGVKTDNFVGLMMDRCANAYVGREGILKSGGAFLAIDPKYPDDRVTYIIEDSKAKLLVVCHCYRENDGQIRIISARKATRKETATYNGRK